MNIVSKLYSSGLGFRCICRILSTLRDDLNICKVPHWTTCRLWILKLGYYEISFKPIEKAKDWVTCLDVTVEVGALKCLLVLGVQLSTLKKKSDLTLTHSDVEVLGIYPTEQSNGKFVHASLEDAEKRVGHPFAAMLLDRGSDVSKGARMYQEGRSTVLIHDISHTVANLLERRLKNDDNWKKFCAQLAESRLSVQQTYDLAALMPSKQRSKARFMNADILMDWHTRFQENKKAGHFDLIPQERLEKHFGWLNELDPYINIWKQMVCFGELVKAHVAANGFSHKTYNALEDAAFSHPDAPSEVIDFMGDVMDEVWNEVEKLKPRQIALGDSRIIESIFGTFKQSEACRLCGITISVLGIAARLSKKNGDTIQIAMESITAKQLYEWGREKFGNTVTRMRRKFFSCKKEMNYRDF